MTALLSDMEAGAGRQTLLVHMGDYVWNGLNEFLWDWQQFNLDPTYASMSTVFSRLPLMGVLGNHEGYDSQCTTEPNALINYQNIGQIFRKYYPYKYPNPKRYYYSFDYGPVHFVHNRYLDVRRLRSGRGMRLRTSLSTSSRRTGSRTTFGPPGNPGRSPCCIRPYGNAWRLPRKCRTSSRRYSRRAGSSSCCRGTCITIAAPRPRPCRVARITRVMTWLVLGRRGARTSTPRRNACRRQTRPGRQYQPGRSISPGSTITGNSMKVTVRPVNPLDQDIDSFTITNGN